MRGEQDNAETAFEGSDVPWLTMLLEEDRPLRLIVSATLAELPLRVAVIVADWLVVTEPALALKVAEEDPAVTLTEVGTVKAELLSERATTVPPLGAVCDSVTVQLTLEPERTLVEEHCNLETVTAGGVTVTAAVAELALRVAVTVTD
jgi:hypothetical protein